jgi:O-antigen/teichoic acid export membrane protein
MKLERISIEDENYEWGMPISHTVEGGENLVDTSRPYFPEDHPSTSVPRLKLPSLSIDQLTTRDDLKAISGKLERRGYELRNSWVADVPTIILPPIISVEGGEETEELQKTAPAEGQVAALRHLIKSAGIYALSSVALPLVSLVLSPFLTHNLSPANYGMLTIMNTAVGLGGGVTQLGLSSAFFRAYGYDYTSQRDKSDIVATTTTLLCLVSFPVVLLVFIAAPVLARLLLGQSSLSNIVVLGAGALLAQNLAVPGMAWLRAENRPFFYSLLSIGNLLITLVSNILLVGLLHWGVTGAVLANSAGYACVSLLTIPVIFLRAGIKIRMDIARGLLAFGLPLVLNFFSYWVLQLSDRYLLSLFASLAETAKYSVVYILGSAMSVVVMGPFTLAWPTAMFAIAKRKDAKQIFSLVFRWFGMFLLFAAFSFSLVGTFLLDWLFPVSYHSSALIIPVVAESIAFYGVYYVFMVGANVQRKTWLAGVFTTIAATSNFLLNLVLIPLYGAAGAAASTLIAYVVLAICAYLVNQRLYPIRFEIGRFVVALLIGVTLYTGCSFLAPSPKTFAAWSTYVGALLLYSGCLALLAKLPGKRSLPEPTSG